MLNNNAGGYAMDYVYASLESGDFRSVYVDFRVVNDNLQFTLESDELIKDEDLEHILKSLQQEKFSKMKISIYDDCDVLLKVKGSSYKVILLNKDMKISRLESVDV